MIHCITIKDHAQTLHQTNTRPQLYSECGMYYLKHEQVIALPCRYSRRERSSSVIFLIKHGLQMFKWLKRKSLIIYIHLHVPSTNLNARMRKILRVHILNFDLLEIEISLLRGFI
jgi:hypothetical protein